MVVEVELERLGGSLSLCTRGLIELARQLVSKERDRRPEILRVVLSGLELVVHCASDDSRRGRKEEVETEERSAAGSGFRT